MVLVLAIVGSAVKRPSLFAVVVTTLVAVVAGVVVMMVVAVAVAVVVPAAAVVAVLSEVGGGEDAATAEAISRCNARDEGVHPRPETAAAVERGAGQGGAET